MKIALFSRSRVSHNPSELRRITESIAQYGFEYIVNEEFASILGETIGFDVPQSKIYGAELPQLPSESVMLCYGGDGTILEGLHRLAGQRVAVVGINSGRLGFLASGSGEDIEQIFSQIESRTLTLEPRKMLRVEGDFIEDGEALYAVNELAVQRLGATMIAVDTTIDGHSVATYHGDGLIVSTPTGSTAYSFAAGGPIIAPNSSSFCLAPLAPHNLTVRPLVVPDSSRIRLSIVSREGEAAISLDNRTYRIGERALLEISLSEREYLLATPSNISFYDTLRMKMMWGIDPRDSKN